MSLVIENLKEALIGESKAQRKYELYAKKALEENHPEIAHLFKAISFAESIHIKNHTRALSLLTDSDIIIKELIQIDEKELKNKVRDTIYNLEDAIEGELYETKKMYKTFEKNAKSQGYEVAELSFSLARDAEKVHADHFSSFLKKLKKGQEIKKRNLFVCEICGNVEFDEPPETCPVCDHSKDFYKEINVTI
ncbi:MAG: rubrerythrin family protein [Promethearchaeota archaeon]|nr:MAG: rubrerythrin family protein [Candidatus Lokiarchaeota archaeon]